MTLERLSKIIEYPDSPELGIKGSGSNRWVPIEFVSVKILEALKSGSKVARGVSEAVSQAVGKLKGEVKINGDSGNIYESQASSD